MKLKCSVIGDLLPLYADNICSEDSRIIVEEHVKNCPDCAEKLDAMNMNIGKADVPDRKNNPFKKVKKHYFKIIIITLIICAVVCVPSVLLVKTYVSESERGGMILILVEKYRTLNKSAKLLKNGKYREFLDTFTLTNEGEYSEEELLAYKAAIAEDMRDYFNKYPIKNIKVDVDSSIYEGIINVYLNPSSVDVTDEKICEAYMEISFIYRGVEWGDCETLFFWESGGFVRYNRYSERQYSQGLSEEFPILRLVSKEKLMDTHLIENDDLWGFVSEKYERIKSKKYDGNETLNEYYRDIEGRLKVLIENYSFDTPTLGECVYMKETLYEGLEREVKRFYLQKLSFTSKDKDGNEFSVSFDVPVYFTSEQFYSNFRNIEYSENTPEDFKEQFEAIFK